MDPPCFVWGVLQKYMFLFKCVIKLWGMFDKNIFLLE